ncbi:MAG TPA: hypothetical protein VMU64_07310 [Acidimicrobiales bacterium]|nr:hypothetical protein [Acidimicrobiales bacterium]
MKIQKVSPDNRRRRFEVTTRRGLMTFPYGRCDPAPSTKDPLVEVYVDPELGREGFTYRLTSGAEGSVHVDSVLDVSADPDHLARLELYRLTTEAKSRLEASGLSVREAAARLGTSPPQLYRLLDPTNYSKSARQLLAVLALGGASVTVADTKSHNARRRRVPA